MIRPEPGLYELAFKRVSRRDFLYRAAHDTALDELDVLANRICAEEPSIRIVVGRYGAETLFRGRIGYGLIRGAVSSLSFIAAGKDKSNLLKIGYYGEWMILAATRLGLSTCWVAGTYNRDAAIATLKLALGEELICISPIGESAKNKTFKELAVSAVCGSKRRKKLEEILVDVNEDTLKPWQRAAIDCARIAPSAVNKQPWRFTIKEDKVCIRAADDASIKNDTVLVDCGIAMFHFSIGARHAEVHGSWLSAKEPYLAEFVQDK